MKRKLIGALYKILFAAPLIIGVIGYLYAGENFSDALYYSIKLYGLNYEETSVPLVGLEIAKWLAPLMTAASIIMLIKAAFSYVQTHVAAVGKNSNVVYGDSGYADMLCENEKDAVRYKGIPITYAKNHFIMFDSDVQNLSFCRKYMHRMKGKNVYLCMDELDAALLKDMQGAPIKFFNPNDVIARSFWKERRLWEKAPKEYKIAIIGFDNLGRRILEKSLQLNLFSTKQKLKYYVFGDTKYFEISHSEMDLMNQDQISYYKEGSEAQWKKLRTMDMVVITKETDLDLIQKVVNCSGSFAQIYYYSPADEKISDYMAVDNLYAFGNSKEVFTLENIKTDRLYQNAINLNDKYAKLYNGAGWEGLTGFLKDSNISAADYGEVIGILLQKGMSDLELAELEHTRWCRFHFLHYWKYGVPQSGKNKDEKEKIHKCLVRFCELDEVNRNKDIEVVEMWKNEK